MALHYIMVRHRKIKIEYCDLKNGDHVFIVIGRNPSSNLRDPSTWGIDAYICDPWSENINVYPAKDYKMHLKNFFHTIKNGAIINHVEDFNSEKHIIQIERSSTDFFHAQKIILDLTIVALCKYSLELIKIKNYLEINYGKIDPKLAIITEKIRQTKKFIVMLNAIDRNLLSEFLQDRLARAIQSALMSDTDLKKINTHRKFETVVRFFGCVPKIAEKINHALSELETNLGDAAVFLKQKRS